MVDMMKMSMQDRCEKAFEGIYESIEMIKKNLEYVRSISDISAAEAGENFDEGNLWEMALVTDHLEGSFDKLCLKAREVGEAISLQAKNIQELEDQDNLIYFSELRKDYEHAVMPR